MKIKILLLLSFIALIIGLILGYGFFDFGAPQEEKTRIVEPTDEKLEPQKNQEIPETPEPDTKTEQEITTQVRQIDQMTMAKIPAGEFLMGDDKSAFAPEKPEHTVYLDDYWIDKLEISNKQYRLCVESGVCTEPNSWNDENFNGDKQPAIVNWDGAQAYCEWAGGRLPTEAEWEKAIRGTDGRTWPWGNKFEVRANLSGKAEGDSYGFTSPVGSFPKDVSPYGLLDAAGNAAEWVADWFDPDYYKNSPARNPTGPTSGNKKVHRAPIANAGGGPEKCRCVARYGVDPNWPYGFRCVVDNQPTPTNQN